MSQQNPVSDGKPYIKHIVNDKDVPYTRRLFLNTGFGFTEVANSKGCIYNDDQEKVLCARIVNDYSPPAPSFKTSEIKLSNAPSRIHADGKASYKIVLRLIFPDRYTLNDFVFFCGNELKFYDEKGAIYSCVLSENMQVQMEEAGRRYDVKINLLGVRKDSEEDTQEVRYTDLDAGYVNYKITISNDVWINDKPLVINFTSLNKQVTVNRSLSTPNKASSFILLIKAKLIQEGLDFYYTLKSYSNELRLIPKKEAYEGSIELNTGQTQLGISLVSEGGEHWAKSEIETAARLGFIAQYDNNGNYVYTFSPDELSTRSQMAVVLNRFRKYIEKVVIS